MSHDERNSANTSGAAGNAAAGVAPSAVRGAAANFASAFVILLLELALIRWIPAHVRVVSYFTNLHYAMDMMQFARVSGVASG